MCWLFFSGRLTPKPKSTGPYNSYRFYLCNKPKVSQTAQKCPRYCIYYVNGTFFWLYLHQFSSISNVLGLVFKAAPEPAYSQPYWSVPCITPSVWPVNKCRCIYVNGTYIVLTSKCLFNFVVFEGVYEGVYKMLVMRPYLY